jgi:hypothetical protein
MKVSTMPKGIGSCLPSFSQIALAIDEYFQAGRIEEREFLSRQWTAAAGRRRESLHFEYFSSRFQQPPSGVSRFSSLSFRRLFQ